MKRKQRKQLHIIISAFTSITKGDYPGTLQVMEKNSNSKKFSAF
jgi:hypothetical protein